MSGELAYKVVKFIVKVRLMENSVNSHVGKVMVEKVMIQYRAPGKTLRMLRTTRASRPKVDEGVGFSAALTVAVCRASAALVRVDDRVLATEAAAELTAGALDMV